MAGCQARNNGKSRSDRKTEREQDIGFQIHCLGAKKSLHGGLDFEKGRKNTCCSGKKRDGETKTVTHFPLKLSYKKPPFRFAVRPPPQDRIERGGKEFNLCESIVRREKGGRRMHHRPPPFSRPPCPKGTMCLGPQVGLPLSLSWGGYDRESLAMATVCSIGGKRKSKCNPLFSPSSCLLSSSSYNGTLPSALLPRRLSTPPVRQLRKRVGDRYLYGK